MALGDHRDAVGLDARAADLFALCAGDGDDVIHESQVESVEAFVHSHAEALAGPAARDGDDGDARAASGHSTQDVRFVAVAQQDGRPEALELRGDLADRGTQIRRVVPQGDGIESLLTDRAEERATATILGER